MKSAHLPVIFYAKTIFVIYVLYTVNSQMQNECSKHPVPQGGTLYNTTLNKRQYHIGLTITKTPPEQNENKINGN